MHSCGSRRRSSRSPGIAWQRLVATETLQPPSTPTRQEAKRPCSATDRRQSGGQPLGTATQPTIPATCSRDATRPQSSGCGQATGDYSPTHDPSNLLQRRATVLSNFLSAMFAAAVWSARTSALKLEHVLPVAAFSVGVRLGSAVLWLLAFPGGKASRISRALH